MADTMKASELREAILKKARGWKEDYAKKLEKFLLAVETYGAVSVMGWQASDLLVAETLARYADHILEDAEEMGLEKLINRWGRVVSMARDELMTGITLSVHSSPSMNLVIFCQQFACKILIDSSNDPASPLWYIDRVEHYKIEWDEPEREPANAAE